MSVYKTDGEVGINLRWAHIEKENMGGLQLVPLRVRRNRLFFFYSQVCSPGFPDRAKDVCSRSRAQNDILHINRPSFFKGRRQTTANKALKNVQVGSYRKRKYEWAAVGALRAKTQQIFFHSQVRSPGFSDRAKDMCTWSRSQNDILHFDHPSFFKCRRLATANKDPKNVHVGFNFLSKTHVTLTFSYGIRLY